MKRFSLKAMLILVTVVGLFLGYSQHRRRCILQTSEALAKDGYVFTVPDKWHDRIWQRKPTVARTVEGGLVFQMHAGSLVAPIRYEDPEQTETRRLRDLGMLDED